MPPTVMPKVVHELGLGAGPSTASPTWTDVSADVVSLGTKRGRQHVLQRYEAGTADYLLWNTDGRYNPTNAASPYYPNILPMVPVRSRAWWNELSLAQSVILDALGYTGAVNCNVGRATSPLPGAGPATGAPTVSSISPISGTAAGGTSVVITGTNLTGATAVMFGATAASSFIVNSPTQITAAAPATVASVVTVDVTVTTANGTSAVSPNDEWTWTFSNGGFSITLTASTNTPTVGSNVTLTATANQNVGPTPYGISIFDVTTGAEVKHVSTGTSTSVVVTQAAASTHRYVAFVCNGGGSNPQAASAPQVVVWGAGTTPPTVTSLTPPSGPTAGGSSVVLAGTGFSGTTQVFFGSFPASSFVVNSSIQITATAPPGATGTVNVSVVTPNGQSLTAAGNQYLYSPYGIVGCLQMTALAGGTMSVEARYLAAQSGDAFGPWDESKGVPIQGGQTATLLASFQAGSVGRSVRVDAKWKDASGTVLSTTTGPTTSDVTSGYIQARTEAIAPAGTALVVPVLVVLAVAGSEIHYASNVGVYPAPGVVAFSAGGPYGIFRGFVESWPQDWPDVATATVSMTAVDAFKVFSYFNLKTPYVMSVTAVPPSIWYRNQEKPGAFLAVDSSGNGQNGIYPPSGVTFGVTGPIVDNGAQAMTFASGSIGITGPVVTLAQGAFTLGVWVKANGHSTFFTDLINSGGIDWRFALGSDGKLYFKGSGIGGSAGGPDLTDNAWHLAVVTRDNFAAGNHVLCYADLGAALSLGTNGGFFGALPFSVGDDISGGGTGVTLAEPFLVMGTALSSAQIAAIYTAGSAWAGDTSGGRVNHVLDRMSWPAGLRAIDTGASVFQGSPEMAGTTGRDHLQTVDDSESGAMFVDGSGNVVFQGRYRSITPPGNTSVCTFGDGGGSEIPFLLGGRTQLVLDDLDIYNEAILARNNGPQQVSEVPASQATYGVRTLQRTNLLNQDDNEVLSAAQWVTLKGSTPVPRHAGIEVDPQSAPDVSFPQVLGLEIRSRVTVNRRAPAGPTGPTLFTQQTVIEGLEHTITPGTWVAAYAMSAAETGTFLVLDHPVLGLLDSNNVLAF